MNLIQLSEITIAPDRQRRTFSEEAIIRLADSILRGLQHAVVLQNDKKTLVAGERRIRAIRLLNSRGLSFPYDGGLVPHGSIPFVTLGELSELELEEAQLEENVCRENLTWQERANAESRLHQLRLKQTQGKQTILDTASEIAGHQIIKGSADFQHAARLADSLLVAKHLDDPEVSSAKSLREAKKIISSKLERLFAARLHAQVGEVASDHKIILGDALVVLQDTESLFDCIITDPPYGVGADTFGSQSTTTHGYNDDVRTFKRIALGFPPLAFRILRPRGHLYFFHDPRYFNLLVRLFKRAGFRVWPRPFIWNKGTDTGMLPDPDFGPRRCYEQILFAIKGDKHVATRGLPDVLTYSPVANKIHGAQKPVDLYVDLIHRSTVPGDKVVDICAGSGTIFPAASRCSVLATGIEVDSDAYNIAKMRLNSKE